MTATTDASDRTADRSASGPLAGVKVLDLSIALTGPYATALMADQVAVVVKLERPGIGDIARWVGVAINNMSAFYLACNRGKRCIAVDLSTEEGLSLLEKQGPRGLNGLRVAPYYGCQLLRPSSVMGFEDPDRPQSLERLIVALGGEVADYDAKSKCCGFPIVLAREEVALRESHVALSQSRDAGADCMVTPCPLCHLAMDAYQRKAEALNATEYNMPVLHLPQLIGLALGLDNKVMSWKSHMVPVDRVLEVVGA